MKRITLLAFSLSMAFLASAQVKIEKLWEFSTKKSNLIEVKDVRNGFDYYDGELYLASRRAADTDIVLYNAATGLVKETGGAINKLPDSPLSMAWAGGDVAIDDHGAIYCVASNNAAIIKWDNKTATPVTFATLPGKDIYGMDIFVDKNGNGCFVGGATNTSTIYYIPITNNTAGEVKTLTVGTALGGVSRTHIVDSKTFWIDGANILPTLIKLDSDYKIVSENAIKTSLLNSGVNGITQFTFNNKTYIIAAANNHAAPSAIPQHSAAIFEINLTDLSLTQVGGYIPEQGLGGTKDDSHFVKPIVNVTKEAAFIYLMGGMDGIACFKFTEEAPAKQDPTASFAENAITKKVGDLPFTNTFTTNSDGAKTYKSSNETAASVNANGQVTILTIGTTTITATTAATVTYNEKTISYTLTVEAAPVIVPGVVVNGSFETGETGKLPTGWIDDKKPGFQIKNQTGIAHTGSNYIECTGTNCRLMQAVPVEIGKTYELSFWYSNYTATNPNGLKNYSLIADGMTPPNYMDIDAGAAPKKLAASTEWTKYTKRFTATAIEMIINIRAYEMCRIDDIALREVQPAVKPSFSYATTAIQKFTDDAKFTNTLTSNTDGKITFESSVPAVATIDDKGEVTIAGIGTTKITAKATATDNYLAAEATYDLTVKAAPLVKIQKLWEKSAAANNNYTWCTGNGTRDMDFYSGTLYLMDRTNKVIRKINVVDGTETGTLTADPTGVSVSTMTDGTILRSLSFASTHKLGVNYYASDAEQKILMPGDDVIQNSPGRIDFFTAYGTLANGYIAAASTNTAASVCYWPIKNGKIAEPLKPLILTDKGGNATGGDIYPINEYSFWVTGSSHTPKLVTLNEDKTDATVTEFGTVKPEIKASGVAQFVYKRKTYVACAEGTEGMIGIYDITQGVDKAVLISKTSDLGTGGSAVMHSPIAVNPVADGVEIFVYSTNNGIAAYKLTDATLIDPIAPTFEYKNVTIKKRITDADIFVNPLNTNTNGKLSYASSDPAVATVDNYGNITILKAGKTTITASAAASEGYTVATASYELTVELVIPSFSYVTTAITKKATDEAFTNELTSDTDGAVTYESSNTAIATVDATGKVTIIKAGETTITAKAAASDKYAAATASYTLTIGLDTPSLSYATEKVEKHADDAPFTNELTSNTDGAITYESSNTGVATVNANGEITILKAGETVITAKAAAGNKYAAATASYELKVLPPVGINEVSTVAQITNTTDGIHIAFEGKALIEIYSINGSLVEKTEAYESHDATLNSGVYIIKVNGKAYKTIK